MIAPVVAFTLQVPSPATTKSSPAFAVPTILTVVASIIPSESVSLPTTSTVTGSPVVLAVELSSTASGALFTGGTGATGFTVTVTVAVSVPPFPSEIS